MLPTINISIEMCPTHRQPQIYGCLNYQCAQNSLMCILCARRYHSHSQDIMNVNKFGDYLRNFLAQEKIVSFHGQTCRVSSIIECEKQKIQRSHQQIIQNITKILDQQATVIFQRFNRLSQVYGEKERCLNKTEYLRSSLIQYLTEYSESNELLELKLLSSNSEGLSRIKGDMKYLQKLTSELRAFEFQNSCLNLKKMIDGQLSSAISRQIQKYIDSIEPALDSACRDSHVLSFKPRARLNNSNVKNRPNCNIKNQCQQSKIPQRSKSSISLFP